MVLGSDRSTLCQQGVNVVMSKQREEVIGLGWRGGDEGDREVGVCTGSKSEGVKRVAKRPEEDSR